MNATYNKLPDDGRVCINIPYEINAKHDNGRQYISADYWNIAKSIGFNFAGCIGLRENSPHRPKNTAWGSWLSCSAPYAYNPEECILVLYKNQWKRQQKGTPYFSDSQEHKSEFIQLCSGIWDYRAQTQKLTEANFSIDLPLNCLKLYSYEEDTILDPFAGSGQTALACEYLERQWRSIEISESYCQVHKERIETKEMELI